MEQKLTASLSGRQIAQFRRGQRSAHAGQLVSDPALAIAAGKFAPRALQSGRQHPVLERRTVAQGPGLRAGMLGEDPTILADDDAIRIGLSLDRTPDCARRRRHNKGRNAPNLPTLASQSTIVSTAHQ